MTRFSPSINAFSGGEIGPLTYGRTDFPLYNMSLRTCDNWIPVLQGPLEKRKGTKFLQATENNESSKLIPYTATNGDEFMLEFSPFNANPALGTINIFSADGVDIGKSIDSPYITSVITDLKDIQYAQIEDLLFITHKNYFPHVFNYHGVVTSFVFPTLVEQNFEFGPLRPENLSQTTTFLFTSVSGLTDMNVHENGVIPPGFFDDRIGGTIGLRTIPQALHDQWVTATGYTAGDYVWSESYESDRVNVYLATTTATSGTRAPGHDEGLEFDGTTGVTWQMVHSEYGFVKLVSVSGGTGGMPIVTYHCEVIGFPEIPINFTVDVGDWRWASSVWSSSANPAIISGNGEINGPGSVTSHEQRMVYGGTEGLLFINASKIDEFANFYPGSILDNAAYQYSINSSEVNTIRFLQSARSLFIGTENGLFAARASSNGAITPTDIVIERSSQRGAKQQQSVQVGESVLFVQNGGVSLREAIFNNDIKGFDANDLSILAHHLGENILNRVVFQREPQAIIWTHDNNGVLLGVTYQRENDILAWHQHNLAPDSTGAAFVEDVATLKDENGFNDTLWVIVKRVIDGNTVRYIEMIDSTSAVWSDSYITYSGVPTTTITGLAHLEGETVKVVGDGANLPDKTVIGGEITLASEVSTAEVGLGYTAKAQTQKIEGGAQTGTSQGKLKRIHNVVLRVKDAGPGLEVGTKEGDKLDQVIFREDGDLMDNPVPSFTGDTDPVPIEQGYEDGGLLYLEHNLPNDCTIIALWPNMSVEDAR